jgi:hypothetical protein
VSTTAQPSGVNLRFRARRFARFMALLDAVVAERGSARIVDLGGTAAYWLGVEPLWAGRPVEITLVNLAAEPAPDVRFASIAGDCRDLSRWPDGAFDIVHSNSVIEHVGRWADMRAFAREARRLAPRHFVQTPNFWFPLEPHFKTPFFHWLPEPARIALVSRFALGAFPRAATIEDAQRFIEDSALLDARRFAHLFPGSEIERERVAGLTKSLIAVRGRPDPARSAP